MVIMEIGKKIKELRLQRNLTQEELAKGLGLTAQAVSKWENQVTAPDIQLLPELSALLGVTIDGLFSITKETRLARIEAMLENRKDIPKEELEGAERYLQDLFRQEEKQAEAALLLAKLHLHQAGAHMEMAEAFAKEALCREPENKEAHCLLRDAAGGVLADWNGSNHRQLIAFYQDFVRENPSYPRGYLWLMDLLLADGRCAEAREALVRMGKVDQSFRVLLYSGNICKAEGDLLEAERLWAEMTEQFPKDWLAWFSRADALASLSRYEEAAPLYRKAFALQPAPRYADALEALAWMAEIQGDSLGAASALEEIIALLEQEWGLAEGETVEKYKQELSRVRQQIGK